MSIRITMPTEEQLAPGPLRDLISGLHRLYLDAGTPASRQISSAIEKDGGARGAPSHETVSAILRRPTQVPRWENIQSMVRTLAAWSHRRPDVDAEVSRFHQLWQTAELAPAAEADTAPPWLTDPSAYARPLPKAMDAVSEPHRIVALLEQMDNEAQDHLLPPLAAALWRPERSATYCIEVMDEFSGKGRPRLARTVLAAGALSRQFLSLSLELRARGRDEADEVLDIAHRHMPLLQVWEYGVALTTVSQGTVDTSRARPRFEDMTRHRPPSEIVELLKTHELQRPPLGRQELADTLLTAIAATYGEEQLLDLTELMRDAGLAVFVSRLWRSIAEERKPLAPLLLALRETGRSWESTAVLRRLVPELPTPRYRADTTSRATRMQGVLEELPKAGLYEEMEALLQIIAGYVRSLDSPDDGYLALLNAFRL
ncbi:hypothetical protein SLUN_01360 [Streptomyces lunaelactis]|uniref:Uncharacterized protein n=1 Tax=Streptomyces lunaelactis TaxID=1535768 RepID=A0A2R4SW64_9ACTN|nr:hypothetical protein [Streptomyces lunaelactis]AVZ71094.1 hypothetical protein SLUN_01360 [Streptomyces lunaelactis]NUK26739.1 hypothetical protein [Streptomyces lunaelactis]NUK88363.1 hypothetical protein [Streptomyces lunaelactis]